MSPALRALGLAGFLGFGALVAHLATSPLAHLAIGGR